MTVIVSLTDQQASQLMHILTTQPLPLTVSQPLVTVIGLAIQEAQVRERDAHARAQVMEPSLVGTGAGVFSQEGPLAQEMRLRKLHSVPNGDETTPTDREHED